MPNLVDISNRQLRQLDEIKKSVRKATNRDISYKQAFEIYATKKPKTRISLIVPRNNSLPIRLDVDEIPMAEIKLDPQIKKLLGG